MTFLHDGPVYSQGYSDMVLEKPNFIWKNKWPANSPDLNPVSNSESKIPQNICNSKQNDQSFDKFCGVLPKF